MKEFGAIDFTPLWECNERARAKGVSEEEIARANAQLFADVQETVLRGGHVNLKGKRHLTWVFMGSDAPPNL